jgi:hypothetical protein
MLHKYCNNFFLSLNKIDFDNSQEKEESFEEFAKSIIKLSKISSSQKPKKM